ncbi:Lsr2 family protein (plasmid) [Rhodococcus sp. USK10]|uniref:Lsr2 dimerization domain-containing protein n=1 Tax=Rhodococcus sp. USK10 TaxID=2789739 RepID=UPI001C5F38C2|nr:Lsr2 family protein [Rhodococcus sp. USK10]
MRDRGTVARKVVVELVTVSVNGVDYEIDLKGKHANKIHKQTGLFIEHATRVGGRTTTLGSSRGTGCPVRRRGNAKEIRAWATEQGYETSRAERFRQRWDGGVSGRELTLLRHALSNWWI